MSKQVEHSQALRQGFEERAAELELYTHGFMRYDQVTADNENALRGDRPKVQVGDYCSPFMQDAWKIYREFHIGLVTKPQPPKHVTRYDGGMSLGGQSVVRGCDFDEERTLRLAAESELEALKGSYQTVHDVLITARLARDRATMEVGNLQSDLENNKRHSNLLDIAVKNFSRLIELQKSQAAMAEKALGAAGEAIRTCIETASVGPQYIDRLDLILAACNEARALLIAANRSEVLDLGVMPESPAAEKTAG